MSHSIRRQVRIALFVLALAATAIPAMAATDPPPYDIYPIPTCRAYDSRPGTGAEIHFPPNGPFTRGGSYDVKLDNRCSLPANADGVVINIAIFGNPDLSEPGNLVIYPAGGSPDTALIPVDALFFLVEVAEPALGIPVTWRKTFMFPLVRMALSHFMPVRGRENII